MPKQTAPKHVYLVDGSGFIFRAFHAVRPLTRSDGTRLPIPQREAELLRYLAEHAGRAVSRDELLQKVWGLDPRGVHTRTVDMAVARLRETLGDDPSRSQVVVTVRGKGYMLGQADGAPESAR